MPDIPELWYSPTAKTAYLLVMAGNEDDGALYASTDGEDVYKHEMPADAVRLVPAVQAGEMNESSVNVHESSVQGVPAVQGDAAKALVDRFQEVLLEITDRKLEIAGEVRYPAAEYAERLAAIAERWANERDAGLLASAPAQAPALEVDGEAGAWYVRLLDEPVARTTEQPGPVNVDWTADGRMVGVEVLSAVDAPAQAREPETEQPEVPCPDGFRWIGQSFACCDGCGLPAWEHAGLSILPKVGASLFGKTEWVLRPWNPGEAEQIRAKWDPDYRPVAEPSTEEKP